MGFDPAAGLAAVDIGNDHADDGGNADDETGEIKPIDDLHVQLARIHPTLLLDGLR
ncbi:hypothetical protein D3C87_2128430 [compost metagenome]